VPELAAELAKVKRVLFVDSSAELLPGQFACRRMLPAATRSLSHVESPASLLALTQAVHGECPRAWLLTIGVARLEFGEALSREVEQSLPAAMAQIQVFLDGRCGP
jgi:hydrogenase maturation protease